MSFAKTRNTGGKSDPTEDNEDSIPGEGIVANAKKRARRRGSRGKGKGVVPQPVVRKTKPGVSVSDDFGSGDSNAGEGSTASAKQSGAGKLRKALSALSKREK
jgi:hypothetical protein